MVKINLRDYYPDYYAEDNYIMVTEDVAEAFEESRRKLKAQKMADYRHKVLSSFDCLSTIEAKASVANFSTPVTEFEKKQLSEKIAEGLSALTETQQRRIYAHYFLGMSIANIAKDECCAFMSVKESIEAARRKLKKFLQSSCFNP